MRRKRPDWVVTYDEKPTCSRCGASITGRVIRTFETDAPVCRQCAFELSLPRKRASGTTERKAVLSPEELRRRNILLGILVLLTFVLSWRAYAVAPLLKPDQPLRLGTYNTNAKGDRCINNLWQLSAALQQGGLPEDRPRCPSSHRAYEVRQGDADTVISCPTPGDHGLESLTASLAQPIPRAVPWRGQ